MKLYAPENQGKYVWQTADSKTKQVSYSVTITRTAPPDACYGHPMGKYDDEGLYLTFCPNVGADDPHSPMAARYVIHPLARAEQERSQRERMWREI